MKDEEKGAIPSEVVEKSSTLHTASFTPHPRGSGLSEEKQIEEMAKDGMDGKINSFCVVSKDGDIYRFLAEEFKHDSGGFAFYIGKQKVAWFDYGIVKAIFIQDSKND